MYKINMSKKRKTRKQKELAAKRKTNITTVANQIDLSPIYKIEKIERAEKAEKDETVEKKPNRTLEKGDVAYLKKDVRHIIAATGIIVSLDILIFVLLNTGVVRLPMFGY